MPHVNNCVLLKYRTDPFYAEDGLYYVTGQGQFVRHELVPVVNTPQTSDFYNKVLVHENHHVQQFAEIEPWSGMWDVDAFYTEVLSQLPGQETREDMEALVKHKVTEWHDENNAVYMANRHEMEWQAHQVSNAEEPPYLNLREEDIPFYYPDPEEQ